MIINWIKMKNREIKAKAILYGYVIRIHESSEDVRGALQNLVAVLNTTSPDDLAVMISSLKLK